MRLLTCFAVAFLFCVSSALSDPTTQPADVQKLLDDVKQAYAQIKSLRLTGTISREFDINGEVTTEDAAFESSFIAPDRFRHSAKGDATVGSDGKQSYFYLETFNRYSATPFGGKSLVDSMSPETHAVLMGQNPSLLMALTHNENQLLFGEGKNAALAGLAQVDGFDCIVLKFDAMKSSVTLFIDARTHLIRQREVDALGALPKDVPSPKKAMIRVHYQTIELNPAIPEDQFAWAAPAGAREAQEERSMAAGEASELEGQPAPAFALRSLDGLETKLEDLKGSVVVLDFWATWCGPCRASLPELAKIDEELAVKGVKVLAINLEEKPEAVKQFLTDKNLKLSVLLDTDGKVSRLYNVTGIPQTVVIAKDGTVKKVIVGFGGDGKPLRDAIDAAMGE
jgi:thiol-disulfide isomerase/thioredoxin/outer membrane lipoprotein-sorting protein